MMKFKATQAPVSIRSAIPDDRLQLNNLLQFEAYVHRHLDWKQPLDWIGYSPFLVAEKKGRVIASLACPPDPPEVAWIRSFATSGLLRPADAWDLLWYQAKEQLSQTKDLVVAGISLNNWFKRLLANSGFIHTHNVVMLSWDHPGMKLSKPNPDICIRNMAIRDLPAVKKIDYISFKPIWRNSLTSLKLAFEQSIFSSVATDGSTLLGYQISTPSPLGGHLARLAVHPDAQGKGIGYALVYDLLEKFKHRGALRVTVNTQDNNFPSLALYKKAHFKLTGDIYPVYRFDIA